MDKFRPEEKILNLSQVEKYLPIEREMEKKIIGSDSLL